jgi:predicted ATPase
MSPGADACEDDAMMTPAALAREVISFGPFSLVTSERLLTWELRTAVDLATLLADQGRRENGRALLQPVFEQFAEGWDTADLKAAGRALSNLG